MKYKVGDKVKIREDLRVGERYGEFSFSHPMSEFLGNIGIISDVDEINDYYEIRGFNHWSWTEDMIEGKVESGNCESDVNKKDKIKKSLVECELSFGENDVKINGNGFYFNSYLYEAEELDDLIELLQETKKTYEQFNS